MRIPLAESVTSRALMMLTNLAKIILPTLRTNGIWLSAPAIGLECDFPLDDFTRNRLLQGLDDIGLTLRHADAIAAFETSRPDWLPTTA